MTGNSKPDEHALGQQILQKLRAKKLPQMVDWYDPGLLVRIGVREVISSTMGQYADQRLLQAASDRVSNEDELALRYDYSDTAAKDPAKRVKADENGAIWVDYIADLGDGFEATYAMAYLMAPEVLEIEGADTPLKAGEILVMGGDQAYPQATAKQYQDRLLNPYNWAFTTDKPERKLFAMPGNHDWYDGLTAFDGLFCSARDRMSHGIGKKIGGWRSQQHRSYFAIKLPHNWWIWGADIQLEGYLDDAQKDYFDLVSEHMGKDDKVIVCLAEPSWLHQDYQNLREISMLARKTGAKVCAVLAGDWHHYSRYHSADLGVHFITCGGGGAFAHATHSLKNRLTLRWPQLTGVPYRVSDPADSLEHDISEQRIVREGDQADFAERTYEITATGDGGESGSQSGELPRKLRREQELHVSPEDDTYYHCESPHIYPSKMKSRLLSLWNLLFPFKHFKFALALGSIYLFFFWIGAGIEREPTVVANYLHDAIRDTESFFSIEFIGHIAKFAYKASIVSPLFFLLVVALWFGLVKYVDVSGIPGNAAENTGESGLRIDAIEFGSKFAKLGTKVTLGTGHALAHFMAIAILSIGLTALIDFSANFHAHAEKGVEGWAPFIQVKLVARPDATPEKKAEIEKENQENKAKWKVYNENLKERITDLQASYTILSPLLMIPIGGIIGGLIWGAYWAFTCAFLSMHAGDAFGALALKDYKHFLRMRFEPDQVTIYPIGLDYVPGRNEWRVPSPSGPKRTHNPQIVPDEPLKPHLIEDPIVIRAEDIK